MKIRLHCEEKLEQGKNILLKNNEYNYLANVLKVKEGQVVYPFNGQDGEFEATVSFPAKKEVCIFITRNLFAPEPLPDVWLMFAMLKKDATDLLVQKSCELGVGTFCPLITQRTVADKVKQERLELIAASAAEQSRRINVPAFNRPQKLQDILAHWNNDRVLFFLDETGKGTKIAETFKAYKDKATCSCPVAFLIGPEGGFTLQELDMLYKMKAAVGVSLDKHILRAETAAMTALALWKYI